MIYSKEVENMCSVCKGAKHDPAPIPEEGKRSRGAKRVDVPRMRLLLKPEVRLLMKPGSQQDERLVTGV